MRTQSNPRGARRAGVKRKPGVPRTRLGRAPSPSLTEAAVLHMAGRLSVDSAKYAENRSAHGTYLNGAISLAVSLNLITEQRAMTLRNACSHLLDGVDMPAQVPAPPVDAAYARVIHAVRRNLGASMDSPADVACLGVTGARKMLERLRADHIIGEADMLGFSRLAVEEH
jgi:hypothetical protein